MLVKTAGDRPEKRKNLKPLFPSLGRHLNDIRAIGSDRSIQGGSSEYGMYNTQEITQTLERFSKLLFSKTAGGGGEGGGGECKRRRAVCFGKFLGTRSFKPHHFRCVSHLGFEENRLGKPPQGYDSYTAAQYSILSVAETARPRE